MSAENPKERKPKREGEGETSQEKTPKKWERKETPRRKIEAKPQLDENTALFLLRAEDPEAFLRTQKETGKITPQDEKPITEVLDALEGTLDFDQRIEILMKLQKGGVLPDAVFHAFASAVIREDNEGIQPIEILKAFVRRAEDLLRRFPEGDIPPEELQKLRGELAALGREKANYIRTILGSRALKNAERPPEERDTIEKIYRIVSILFPEITFREVVLEEGEALRSSVALYEFIRSVSDFTMYNRSFGEGTNPAYTTRGQFEITDKVRVWRREHKSEIDQTQKRVIDDHLKNVEMFLLALAPGEIRQFVQKSQEGDRLQNELEKNIQAILETNRELSQKLGIEKESEQMEEIRRSEQEGIREQLLETLHEVLQTESIPILESHLKRLIYLNEALLRLRETPPEMPTVTKTTLTPEQLRREATAVTRELEARVYEADRAQYQDELSRNPAEKRAAELRKFTRQAEKDASDLYRTANDIREGRMPID